MKRSGIDKFAMIIGVIVALCFFIFLLLLASCKPQKMISDSKLNQEVRVNSNLSSLEENQFQELTNRVLKLLLNEKLDVSVSTVKYDTEKPADPVTGIHPVSETTDIKINRETSTAGTDSTHRQSAAASAIKTVDNSNIAIKTKSEVKETKQTGLNSLQRKLIAIGVLSIIAVVAFIIVKTKKS